MKKQDNWLPAELTSHLLDHSSKIYSLERGLFNTSNSFQELVNTINKVNLEISKRVQAVEARMGELEKMLVDAQNRINTLESGVKGETDAVKEFGHDA